MATPRASQAMVTLISLLGFAALFQQASAGCFWDTRCQNLWMGGCGDGFVPVETSSDCQGLCSSPQYGACPLFFSRFQCCREDKARLSKTCSRCPSRKDVGNEWVCCSDCSEPAITDGKSKTGYCQTDAYLTFQPKPREVFKWTAREWTTCTGRCKKASRSREVRCLLYVENALYSPTVVADDKCSASNKPPTKERCTPQSCMDANHQKRHGLPIWAIVLISLTCVAAVGGLAFAGFIIYRRRSDNGNHGFVYVMLDSY
ncbi:hypothetical protein KC19_12G157400 [Ceratodon purpureus]|uniref:Uncharacterized protein n=1 Tax=Ceratodon purpureus TaxID=3225 RepID=A0A8T0GBB9_CERPU|nr:hypothetical protein KC19_12G157400 [Ceratodon purpureus]